MAAETYVTHGPLEVAALRCFQVLKDPYGVCAPGFGLKSACLTSGRWQLPSINGALACVSKEGRDGHGLLFEYLCMTVLG